MSRAALSLLPVAALLLLVGQAVAESDKVVKLGSDYEDAVTDGKVYFIKYFAPWCGHCKRLAPTWNELAGELESDENVVIASVDCTQHRDVCTSADVKGYPTLKVVHKGEEFKAYRGARDVDSLKAFAQEAAKELLEETTE